MTPEIDHHAERPNDPRSTEELVRLALTEEDEDAAWNPVVVLHFRASHAVLLEAQRLCHSDLAKERKLGADILSQLGVPDRTFPEECYQILKAMLREEGDPEVLQAIAQAFGHLNDPRAIELLVPLVTHPNEDVRFGVVHGISRHEDQAAIDGLTALSRDEDDDVRNWATFGLGSMIETDTPQIREALFARITDSHNETRGEALTGLAQRKDDRVIEPLIHELKSESVGMLALEAAEEIADTRLGPALLALKESWTEEDDAHVRQLHRALLACLPTSTC